MSNRVSRGQRTSNGVAAIVVAVLLGTFAACGGGNEKPAATPPAAAPNSTATTAPAPQGGGAPASITGKTVDVKMLGDQNGYRFEPANFTVKVGDGARFTNVSGGPHNVTFWSDSIPPGMANVLNASMPGTTAPLTGPLLTTPNQTYTISFAGLKPGVYHYYCTPHLALGMKGVITVQ